MSEQTKTVVKQGGMNTKVRYITVTAMLSAVAFVLMYLEIAIPIMPSFIKFDFSDLPALLGSFALGPVCGVLICLIKNVLHLAFSNSMFVGELSNFILGAVFVAIAGNIYKHKKTKKSAVVSGLVAALVMGIVSVWGIDLSDQERSPSGIFKQYVCWRTFQFYSRSRICGNCR